MFDKKIEDPTRLGVDVVHDLGARGRQLLAEAHQRGQRALTADQSTARGQQTSDR